MFLGREISVIDNLASSNDYVKNQAKSGLIGNGEIISVLNQTGGRGQEGTKWESEPGKNLVFSVYLNDINCKAEDQFYLSMTVSLGICKYLNAIIPGFKIKWPNDIYFQDKKIAGILIENTIQENSISESIIGIGININQTLFSKSIPNPISLKLITGKDYDIDFEITKVIYNLNKLYSIFFEKDYKHLLDEYYKFLYRFDESYSFLVGEERIKGSIIGIDEYGRLVLKDESGSVRTFGFKEVEYCF